MIISRGLKIIWSGRKHDFKSKKVSIDLITEKIRASNINLLECPVCIDLMVGRIYQCLKGHSLCQQCLSNIPTPKKCPLCRENMTNVRNITVENLVEVETQRRLDQLNVRPVEVQTTPGTTKINCRFKSEGCKYVLQQKDYEGHVEECIFRDILCPYSTFNSSCFWIGKFSMLKNHFSSQHPDGILVEGREYETPGLQSTGMVRLIVLDKLHFILHWQRDAAKNIVQVAVQNIGTKAYAQNWNYEVKFYKEGEPRRGFSFTDICKSDSVQTREIFQNKHCIIIPNSIFNEFGTRLRFKVVLQKKESMVTNNRKGPKPISNTSSLTLP